MPDLVAADFAVFFEAVHGNRPFPWQQRLAEAVVRGQWPDAVTVPTGAGKTACIDVAVFALALQADLPPAERTAPRRIFFVVDRRIVVDAAFDRATRIADALRNARGGVVRTVANGLRRLGASEHLPLACEQLRGGMRRHDLWARTPAQPAIVASTVDQYGSRLLFRSYDSSPNSAPIPAGLAGHDVLVFLDEVHCAVPFMQTLEGVMRHRGSNWAQQPIPAPFRAVLLSATPPSSNAIRFEIGPEDREDPTLSQRLRASKPARLKTCERAADGKRPTPTSRQRATTALATELSTSAFSYIKDGAMRIAIVVNRVRTAEKTAQLIREREGEPDIDVVLMTGRMRAMDRVAVLDRWLPLLAADPSRPDPDRPVVVVATQCIEVGADFSFDALVTECASLEALRQRFGRVDRLGERGSAPCTVVVRGDQAEVSDDDPVYGSALAETWTWLNEVAVNGKVDFGTDAFEKILPAAIEARSTLLAQLAAPHPDAPVLLPSHLDLLCQTNPRPCPDPDIAVFLHGPQRGSPDVRVLWRADLPFESRDRWTDTVALVAPTQAEAMPVPLYRLHAWMTREEEPNDSDAESEQWREPGTREDGEPRWVVVWRGLEESIVTNDPGDVQPGDFVVLPEYSGDIGALGQIPPDAPLDVAERAQLLARDRAVLRIHEAGIESNELRDWAGMAGLLTWAAGSNRLEDVGDLDSRLEVGRESAPPWLTEVLDALLTAGNREVLEHPAGGYVLRGRRALNRHESEADPFVDQFDRSSEAGAPVLLSDHHGHVESLVRSFAAHCGLADRLAEDVALAARYHDLGKTDERFQLLLHHGDELAAALSESPLAKSAHLPMTAEARRRVHNRTGLPDGFRHELLSVRLLESTAACLRGAGDQDLVLHLLASHHGRCRPFAPVVRDENPVSTTHSVDGFHMNAVSDTGLERIDSGTAERFWMLTRKYGWWGLAFLEAILRLADRRASESEEQNRPVVSTARTGAP